MTLIDLIYKLKKITMMKTGLTLIAIIMIALFVMIIIVTIIHTHMTPEQINASGNFFKQVLTQINIAKIIEDIVQLFKGNTS